MGGLENPELKIEVIWIAYSPGHPKKTNTDPSWRKTSSIQGSHYFHTEYPTENELRIQGNMPPFARVRRK